MVDWEAIASFYAGRPTTVSYDLTSGLQGGTYGQGSFQLSPKIKKHLDDFIRYQNDPDKGPVLGTLGLATLIHEAIHNNQGLTKVGMLPPDSEKQASYMASELVGDLLPRFFGIGRGSNLWKKYMFAARNFPSARQPDLPKNLEDLYWKLQPDDQLGTSRLR